MLGEGAQSTIKKGTWQGKPCAFKKLTDMDYVLEPFLLLSLCHENIISAYGITGLVPGGLKLVLELADCDLVHHIRKNNPSEEKRLEIFNSLLCAVAYLHQNGVYHGDIKAHNCLMLGGKLKLADFGSATVRGGRSKLSTPLISSPQIISGESRDQEKSDIWALGVTFFFILTGQYLFSQESKSKFRESLDSFLSDRTSYLSSYNLKPEHTEMLLCMLEKDEKKRTMPAFVEKHIYPPLFKGRVLEIPPIPPLLEKVFCKTRPEANIIQNATLLYTSLPQDMQNTDNALACYSLCYRLKAPYPKFVSIRDEYYNTRWKNHEERILQHKQGLLFSIIPS
nr:kinase [Cedratvirus plubellavi]